MGAYVDIDTREVLSLSDKISGAQLSSKDREQLLHSLGVELETQTQERFATKVAPDGNRWKDIAEATKEWYRKQGKHGQPPLVLEGFLRDSLESQVQDGAWSVLVGATREYASVHQFGFKKKKIAPRPFLGINTDDEADLVAIIDGFIERKLQ